MPLHRAEIISIAQMRAIDAGAESHGASVDSLMRAAGQAVADAVTKLFSPRPILFVCGPGNNGGDGWAAARILKDLGWPVRVCSLCTVSDLAGAAKRAASAWDGPVEATFVSEGASLFVDAMFGAGLSRPLEGAARDVAAFFSANRAHVVAVDIPSGVSGDTGKPLGAVFAAARCTVTFVRKKPGHVLLPGRGLCGEIVLADIGAPEAVVAALGVGLWENKPGLWLDRFPWPEVEAHKHKRGHVLVASGGLGQTGAARMAARAALRVGAGLVTVLAPTPALPECAAQLTAIMLREAGDGAALNAHLQSAAAFVIGPAFGLSEDRDAAFRAALAQRSAPCVIDADALTLLSWRLADWPALVQASDVMTPHVGEFERLFPGLLAAAPSRVEAARAAAAKANCVVLLKGPDTVIAAPDGRAVLNVTGSPFLATAGSGDVLAGTIAGLIGQGMESFWAASAAAYVHGKAGEDLGPGLIAEDLPEIFPRILRGLKEIDAPVAGEEL